MTLGRSVAVVHDWLTVVGGAERVLAEIISLYPTADLFSVVDFLPPEHRGLLRDRPVQTSFVQRLPFAQRYYRQYLPLMPLAVEQFDLSAYDVVISSSYAVAKGVITGPDQVHVSYVHSPMRYAWDLTHEYLKASGLTKGIRSLSARYMLHRLRLWDSRTANSVDRFVANSHFIARRIRKVYGRDAEVVYPPVDIDRLNLVERKDDYYVTVSRLVPYKRVDLIVEAFSLMPHRKLVVVGDGPGLAAIKAKATPNIEILGYQSDETVRDLVAKARAFVFAAQEDFGIVVVEAQACGTPVILFGRGGAPEAIRGLDQVSPTGVFFPSQTVDSLIQAVEEFEAMEARILPAACRANAERFSVDRFRERFSSIVEGEVMRSASRRKTRRTDGIRYVGDAHPVGGETVPQISRSERARAQEKSATG